MNTETKIQPYMFSVSAKDFFDEIGLDICCEDCLSVTPPPYTCFSCWHLFIINSVEFQNLTYKVINNQALSYVKDLVV